MNPIEMKARWRLYSVGPNNSLINNEGFTFQVNVGTEDDFVSVGAYSSTKKITLTQMMGKAEQIELQKPFVIYFEKKDGTMREMYAVKRGQVSRNLLPLRDLKLQTSEAYRQCNLTKIKAIVVDDVHFIL